MSFPSAWMPLNPKAMAFWAIVADAVCFLRGRLMAHWLFCTTQTSGSLKAPATFIASLKSPSLVPPSPTKHSATVSSFRSLQAQATPAP